jgi:hypothetical protein
LVLARRRMSILAEANNAFLKSIKNFIDAQEMIVK